MERLRATDLQLLIGCIGELYADPDLATFPTRVLSIARRLVPSDSAAYEEINLQTCRTIGVSDPAESRPTEDQLRIWEHYLPQHPIVNLFATGAVTETICTSQVISRADYHGLGIYGDFYKPYSDVEDQAGLLVAGPRPLMIGVGVNRASWGFSDRDRLVLDALRPHVLQAYRNAESMTRARADLAWAKGVHEAVDEGIVSTDSGGRMKTCTAKARRWMEAYFPRWRHRGLLPDELARWAGHHAAAAADGEPPPPREPFVVEGMHGRLVARLVPDPVGQGALLLLDERRPQSVDGQIVAAESDPAVAGLAPRVRRVLDRLLRGDSEKQVAAQLDLSPHTVHEYVKTIYRELDVGSRGELLARFIDRRAS